MSAQWKLFLAIRFPIAVFAFLGFFQIFAMALSHVPLRRFETDSLPEAISRDSDSHRALLFGDSTAQTATRRYNVGTPDRVLNLATHAHIGLSGSLLLLRRYLATHSPPEYVFFVTTPSFFALPQEPRKLHYYTWNVFQRPEEHALLKQLYPAVDADEWTPAAMNLQQKIVEPLLSLLQRGPAKFYPLGADPDANAPLEPASTNVASDAAIRERFSEPTDLTDPAAVAIRYVCQESAKYGFKIGIAWAPAPVPVAVHWRETKALEKLEDQIRKAMGPECASTEFSNFNDSTAYLAFDHIALHLRGIGWEQRLTSQMKSYIERALQNRRAEALTSSQRP